MNERGHTFTSVELPTAIRQAVSDRNWDELDRLIRQETLVGGSIFSKLSSYRRFEQIEFIISIRSSSLGYPDEDGIWHDDGSRLLAFSLSLTSNPGAIDGGVLEIRKRNTPGLRWKISTPDFGTMVVFATGRDGFEHKINRVVAGERIIIAGWCT